MTEHPRLIEPYLGDCVGDEPVYYRVTKTQRPDHVRLARIGAYVLFGVLVLMFLVGVVSTLVRAEDRTTPLPRACVALAEFVGLPARLTPAQHKLATEILMSVEAGALEPAMRAEIVRCRAAVRAGRTTISPQS